jgi:hypothetical protein
MKRENLIRPAGLNLISRKYLVAACVGLVLILLTAGFTRQPAVKAAGLHLQAATPTATVSGQAGSGEPLYYKKVLVFKRVLAESEAGTIRTSAQTDGYKALENLPLPVVMPQLSIRTPQFPDTTVLNNYQALSTLGTEQFYENQNVQQYLSELSNQQALNNQQFLDNYQQNLNNLTNQINNNALSNQQYLNNFQQNMNNLSAQQFLNTMSNQQYLNNFNNYTSPVYNPPSFTQPSFTQPMYNPPPIYNPPPVFYNPPPSFNNFP